MTTTNTSKHDQEEAWDLLHISEETRKLISKAAKHEKKSVAEWVEDALKLSAEQALDPAAAVNDPATLGALLRRIDKRLAHIENSPLQNSARMVSEGAKVFTDSARDIYERVEARKWFDKSYEAATKACDTLSQQFKSWWESRGTHTTSTTTEKPDMDMAEDAQVVEEAKPESKSKKEEG